ncbi:hypothetical protein NON20_13500 [Synechocystis sp. B12]|nr:hypothetical protein NON20_13500 [Synechocystis sp. B12]
MISAQLELIENFIDQENYEEAIAILVKHLKEDEPDPSIYAYLGLAHFLAEQEINAQEFWASLLLSFNNGAKVLISVIKKEASNRLEKNSF